MKNSIVAWVWEYGDLEPEFFGSIGEFVKDVARANRYGECPKDVIAVEDRSGVIDPTLIDELIDDEEDRLQEVEYQNPPPDLPRYKVQARMPDIGNHYASLTWRHVVSTYELDEAQRAAEEYITRLGPDRVRIVNIKTREVEPALMSDLPEATIPEVVETPDDLDDTVTITLPDAIVERLRARAEQEAASRELDGPEFAGLAIYKVDDEGVLRTTGTAFELDECPHCWAFTTAENKARHLEWHQAS